MLDIDDLGRWLVDLYRFGNISDWKSINNFIHSVLFGGNEDSDSMKEYLLWTADRLTRDTIQENFTACSFMYPQSTRRWSVIS